MKTTNILLIVLLIVSSCSCQFWFKPNLFTVLYDGQYTGLDTMIRTDGYYISDSVKSWYDGTHPYSDVFVFYQDGSHLWTYYYFHENNEDCIDNERYNNYDSRTKWLSYNWGTYKMIGSNQSLDSAMKVQTFFDYGVFSRPSVVNMDLQILSDTVLRVFSHVVLYGGGNLRDTIVIDSTQIDTLSPTLYHFHPYSNLIDSTNNHLLKRKWFWNKAAYKKRKK